MTDRFEPESTDPILERQATFNSLTEDNQRYLRISRFALFSSQLLLFGMLLTETCVDHWERTGTPELVLGIGSVVTGFVSLVSGIKALRIANEQRQWAKVQLEAAEGSLQRAKQEWLHALIENIDNNREQSRLSPRHWRLDNYPS